jgi:hypothetical protein
MYSTSTGYSNEQRTLLHHTTIISHDCVQVSIYLFIQVYYCPYATLGYERPTPHL